MKYFDPNLLEKWTDGFWVNKPQNEIANFCFDTRKLNKDECFLAIKNVHNDGHNYVKMAEKCGAVAAIVEHKIPEVSLPQLVVKNTLEAFQKIAKSYRKTLSTKIIGVTGSCGKTTLKELLALLLGENTFKTPDNFNNHLGLPFSITQIDPEVHKNAVIEVGISHPNEMDVLADMLQPDESVLTNIAPVHLKNFDSLDAIGIEKFKLLNQTKGCVYFKETFQFYNRKKDHFYILSESKKETHNNIHYSVHQVAFGWNISINNLEFFVPFRLGEGAIHVFVLAIVVALKNGIAPYLLQERLKCWKPFQNRGVWEVVNSKHYFIDCYNANPASFHDSLQHFYNERPKNAPTCFILGSMEELGSTSETYHKKIADSIEINTEDHFICVGRSCEAIRVGLVAKGLAQKQIQCAKTTAEVTPLLTCLPQNYFYLKGSHCYHLENLVAKK